jgi:acyl-CoA synthetase (AMP-forming)/AMP-acid ligase II
MASLRERVLSRRRGPANESGMRPVTSTGELIFPGEVEAGLRYHPDVADAAVMGLPDPMMVSTPLLGSRFLPFGRPTGRAYAGSASVGSPDSRGDPR